MKTKEELATEYALTQKEQNCNVCGEGSLWVSYCDHFLAGYSAAESRIEELVLQKHHADLTVNAAEEEIGKLREKLKIAVDALEFYASRDNWKFQSYSNDCKDMIHFSDVGCKSFNGENNFADYACGSGGRRAREALAKIEGKDEN